MPRDSTVFPLYTFPSLVNIHFSAVDFLRQKTGTIQFRSAKRGLKHPHLS